MVSRKGKSSEELPVLDDPPEEAPRDIPRECWRSRRRRFHKTKEAGGYLNTCRIGRAAVFLAASLLCPMFGAAETVAHNFSEGSRALCQKLHGTSRPDILEIFGGHAEVSLTAARRGWWCMEPVDLQYGADLYDPQQREQILQEVKVKKPRLVLLEFPCKVWGSLSENNYHRGRRQGGQKSLRSFVLGIRL